MAKPNPNENCLAGMACPKCGSFGPFAIDVVRTVIVSDDGTEDESGDTLWEDSSGCRCKNCGHAGVVADFKEGALSEEELVALGYEFNDDPDTKGHTYFLSPSGQGSESFFHKVDAVRAAAADAKATYELSRCDNCGKVHTETTVKEAKDLHERTEPGGTVPSGECSECGSLCYPIE